MLQAAAELRGAFRSPHGPSTHLSARIGGWRDTRGENGRLLPVQGSSRVTSHVATRANLRWGITRIQVASYQEIRMPMARMRRRVRRRRAMRVQKMQRFFEDFQDPHGDELIRLAQEELYKTKRNILMQLEERKQKGTQILEQAAQKLRHNRLQLSQGKADPKAYYDQQIMDRHYRTISNMHIDMIQDEIMMDAMRYSKETKESKLKKIAQRAKLAEIDESRGYSDEPIELKVPFPPQATPLLEPDHLFVRIDAEMAKMKERMQSRRRVQRSAWKRRWRMPKRIPWRTWFLKKYPSLRGKAWIDDGRILRRPGDFHMDYSPSTASRLTDGVFIPPILVRTAYGNALAMWDGFPSAPTPVSPFQAQTSVVDEMGHNLGNIGRNDDTSTTTGAPSASSSSSTSAATAEGNATATSSSTSTSKPSSSSAAASAAEAQLGENAAKEGETIPEGEAEEDDIVGYEEDAADEELEDLYAKDIRIEMISTLMAPPAIASSHWTYPGSVSCVMNRRGVMDVYRTHDTDRDAWWIGRTQLPQELLDSVDKTLDWRAVPLGRDHLVIFNVPRRFLPMYKNPFGTCWMVHKADLSKRENVTPLPPVPIAFFQPFTANNKLLIIGYNSFDEKFYQIWMLDVKRDGTARWRKTKIDCLPLYFHEMALVGNHPETVQMEGTASIAYSESLKQVFITAPSPKGQSILMIDAESWEYEHADYEVPSVWGSSLIVDDINSRLLLVGGIGFGHPEPITRIFDLSDQTWQVDRHNRRMPLPAYAVTMPVGYGAVALLGGFWWTGKRNFAIQPTSSVFIIHYYPWEYACDEVWSAQLSTQYSILQEDNPMDVPLRPEWVNLREEISEDELSYDMSESMKQGEGDAELPPEMQGRTLEELEELEKQHAKH